MPCAGRLHADDLRAGLAVLGQCRHGAWRAWAVRAQRARRLRVRIARMDRSSSAMVGATIVGSVATVWHGVVNTRRPAKLREWRYDDGDVVIGKGEEMGRFHARVDRRPAVSAANAGVQSGVDPRPRDPARRGDGDARRADDRRCNSRRRRLSARLEVLEHRVAADRDRELGRPALDRDSARHRPRRLRAHHQLRTRLRDRVAGRTREAAGRQLA